MLMAKMPIQLRNHSEKASDSVRKLCPYFFEFDLFNEEHRENAYRFHNQTLERLAERGGLSPTELRCVLSGEKIEDLFKSADFEANAIHWIVGYLRGRKDKKRVVAF